jgi:hypothetical protein
MTSGPNSLTPLQRVETMPAVADLSGARVRPASIWSWQAIVDAARWVFSFPAMMGALLVAGVFISVRQFNVDPDVWWHVKVGESLLQTHHFFDGDPFSFTVLGQPWMSCEWIGDVLLALAARIGGVQGLDALFLIEGAAIVIALYVLATMRAKNSKAGFAACALLLPLALLSFNLRPQMLGYLFLVLTLIALERFREGHHRAIWFLPPLFLIWVNAHGSFPIGLGTIGLYWMSGFINFRAGRLEARAWTPSERRSLSTVLLLCFAALLVTPYGSRLAAYPFEVAFKLPQGVAAVQEWRTMPFNEPGGKLFLVLLLGFLVAQITFDIKWRLEEIGLFLFGTLMACLHLRFLLIFIPFFLPLVAVIFARWLPAYDRKKDIYFMNAALMALVLLGIWRFFPTRGDLDQKIAQDFPVNAVNYMQQHAVPDPLFHSYGFGGYLIYSRWPEHKIFIDGRADPFERGGVFIDYLYIVELHPGALSVLRNYGIRSVLLQRGENLIGVLDASPEWTRVYADEVSVLFVRRDSLNLDVASTMLPPAARASENR